MRYGFCSGDKRRISAGGRIGIVVFLLITAVLFTGPVMALDYKLFDRQLLLNGYINQGVQFGVAGDHYDTMQGFQQAIMQVLLEADYQVSNDMKVFVTGMLFKDWAYDIYSTDDDWSSDQPPKDPVGRRFREARSEMSLRNDYEDILKECHVTWTPGDFNIRIGKQIVSWGRMDGVRIMDRINPLDRRLGPSDVEFETTIIPIWLLKMEYYPNIRLPITNDLGIEFTFNPNADFIGDKGPTSGNSQSGIWAADRLEGGGFLRIGELDMNYEEPDNWDSDGYEYGLRIKTTLVDETYLTLNFFDGVDNSAVKRPDLNYGMAPFTSITPTGYVDDEFRGIYEAHLDGYYPDLTYAGFTLAREFEDLNIAWLGGVAPLIRVEAVYEFASTFNTRDKGDTVTGIWEDFEKHDVINWGIGVDWKFKWNLLNPRRYFSLVPQFSHKHVRDYPSTYTIASPGVELTSENEYSFSIRMSTQYFHDKLEPFIFFQRNIFSDLDHKINNGSAKADLWLFRLNYMPNSTWTFKTQLSLFSNDGYTDYSYYDHKDNFSFTVSYQF